MSDPLPTNETDGSRAIANIISDVTSLIEKAIKDAYEKGVVDGAAEIPAKKQINPGENLDTL